MKKILIILCAFSLANLNAQNLILNGSFEDNIVPDCAFDDYAPDFNDSISDITAYGYQMGILKDSCITCPPFMYGGGAQNGHWLMIVVARPFNFPQGLVWGRSKFSMHLSTSLDTSKNYKLSFYIKKPPPSPDTLLCWDLGNTSISIGMSNVAITDGDLIYQSPIGIDAWVQYSVVFKPTINGQYITIQADSGVADNNQLFIDNFVLEETTEHITTWHCINNSCVDTANGSGTYTSLAACIDDCSLPPPVSINENNVQKQLIKIIDILGRETEPKKNTPLFYLYDDGTVEKRIVVE